MNDAIAYINGAFVPWETATVHLMSHSVARGSAIFEVIGFHSVPPGRVIFRLRDHVIRLFRTAELLDMKIPLSQEALCRAVIETLRHSRSQEGMIKIVCYYSQIAFEVLPPRRTLDVAIFVIDPDLCGEEPGLSFDGGATLCISKWRKLDPQTVPIEAKVAANYLNGMLARDDACKRGFDFALMLDTEGHIAEGATESIFLVQGKTLVTPALGRVLDGITRRSILEAADAEGIESREGRLSSDFLFQAEEVFLSGTPKKLIPVKQIEDRHIKKTPGAVTKVLTQRMAAILKGADNRFKKWLTIVD